MRKPTALPEAQLSLQIPIATSDDHLLAYVQEHSGLFAVTPLADGTLIALGRLLYTTALYVDVNATGYDRRYCYETDGGAVNAYYRMLAGAFEPTGYIAKRGGD